MAQRILPGAYVSLNDLSQLPEGQTALTVGYVVQANRGPVNQLQLVTSPTDFLTRYTFSGKPGIGDDKTFWSILKVLSRTNVMYVSRAANNPLYGGIVLKASLEIGTVTQATAGDNGEFVVTMNTGASVAVGDTVMVSGNKDINGCYIVKTITDGSNNTKTITVTGKLAKSYSGGSEVKMDIMGASIDSTKMADVDEFSSGNRILFIGDIQDKFSLGCKFEVKNSSISANNTKFTVETNEAADPISYDLESNITTIIVQETVTPGAGSGSAYYAGLTNPNSFDFDNEDDLMLITGIDPGEYNNDIALEIKTSKDFPEDFVYYNGASVGGKTITFDTMELIVKNSNTGDILETFLFSRDPNAKTIDGISLYVDAVVEGSAYIKVINNTKAGYDLLPKSTITGSISPKGGDNGGDITPEVIVAALEPFKEKTTTISILGNGCSTQAETKDVQQALMGIADERQDLFVFLNNPAKNTENKTLNSQKAQAIVDYKKNDLRNTSFYGCMYAPHVNVSDTFNQRQVKIGAEAVAIAGWLGVINNLNYPYAYAGPRNGLVQGATCDWKIGDMSGEAQILNDASVNYVAFDGKVGRYYMQCQNTLQVANSSMRNIGTVLNVLDIKEHFVTLLKEYLQLPITNDLRREIIDVSNDYLSPMLGVRFSNYSFQDVTTDFDLADNTLRYLLTIAPTPYAQKIYLVMNIVNATFDFSIVQSM